jgi:hypothetical protein
MVFQFLFFRGRAQLSSFYGIPVSAAAPQPFISLSYSENDSTQEFVRVWSPEILHDYFSRPVKNLDTRHEVTWLPSQLNPYK